MRSVRKPSYKQGKLVASSAVRARCVWFFETQSEPTSTRDGWTTHARSLTQDRLGSLLRLRVLMFASPFCLSASPVADPRDAPQRRQVLPRVTSTNALLSRGTSERRYKEPE